MNRIFLKLRKFIRYIYRFRLRPTSSNYRTEISFPTNNYKLMVPYDQVWAFPDEDYYEKNVIHFLDAIINSYNNPVMVDVGANCGYYTIRYSTLCSQIFSFEPVKKTFGILKKNINRNYIKNVTSINTGLSDVEGELQINIYNSSANNSMFERTIPEEHSLKKLGTELIKLDTLDKLIETGKVSRPDIIKIDVEGAELQVLKGAERTISEYRPTIVLEYSENTSLDAGYSKELLLSILNLVNYKIYGIPENELNMNIVIEKDFDKHKLSNIIFTPKELNLVL